MEDSQYLLGAYQKKAFDLFNNAIATEAKALQLAELVEAYKKKVEELAGANQQLAAEVSKLRTHVDEQSAQIENLSKVEKTPAPTSGRRSRKKSASLEQVSEIQDGGSF